MDNNPVNYTDVRGLHKDNGDGTVTVEKKDDLSKIAAAHGTTWQKLYELNKKTIGEDPDVIQPGMVLDLPEKPQEQKNNQQNTDTNTGDDNVNSDDSSESSSEQDESEQDLEDFVNVEDAENSGDIKVYNNQNKLLATIKTGNDNGGQNIVLDTDISIGEPKTIDLTEIDPENEEDAVGISFSYDWAVGGGFDVGVAVVLFQDGSDEGEVHIYGSRAGQIGLKGGIGYVQFSANFNDDIDSKYHSLKSATGFAGSFNAYNVGFLGIVNYTYSWSEVGGKHDRFYPNTDSTTWSSNDGFGLGIGEVGASWSGGKLFLLK